MTCLACRGSHAHVPGSLELKDRLPRAVPQALVSELKAQLAQASNTPANLQRLVFRGRVLKDERRLTTYGSLPAPSSS